MADTAGTFGYAKDEAGTFGSARVVKGKTAYEMAVENGYTGTEEEFIRQVLSVPEAAEDAASSAAAAAKSAAEAAESAEDAARSAAEAGAARDEAVDYVNRNITLVGTPLVAMTAAEMVDTSKVYIYAGSEDGWNNGHWYYYDGTRWVDGGVYNAVAIKYINNPVIMGDKSELRGFLEVYNADGTELRGYVGGASGRSDPGETKGVALVYGARPDELTPGDSYIIATEAGARMQAGGTSLYVISGGAYVSGKKILTEADFLRTKKLDFSGWDAGYFEETLDGNITERYTVAFDSGGRPISIADSSGHITEVVW